MTGVQTCALPIYQIWTATWDETNDKLLKVTAEMSVGTISDENVVEVSAVLSQAALFAESRLLKVEVLEDVTRTLTLDDCGKLFHVHDTMGGSTIDLPSGAPVGFWFRANCVGSASATIQGNADDFFGHPGGYGDEAISVAQGDDLLVYKHYDDGDYGYWGYIGNATPVPPPEE